MWLKLCKGLWMYLSSQLLINCKIIFFISETLTNVITHLNLPLICSFTKCLFNFANVCLWMMMLWLASWSGYFIVRLTNNKCGQKLKSKRGVKVRFFHWNSTILKCIFGFWNVFPKSSVANFEPENKFKYDSYHGLFKPTASRAHILKIYFKNPCPEYLTTFVHAYVMFYNFDDWL